jgi:opacity protein-like surface antigen
MQWTRITITLAMIAFFAPYVAAQSMGVGPQIGFHRAADADNGNFMGGAALRLKLTPALGVEGSINYRQEQFINDALTVRSWPIMVTGMLYPLPVAYGAIGAGWYNTTFDFNSDILEDETSQEFGWHFGAGVELPVGTNVKLTGDLRYVFLDYDFDEVPFDDVDSNFYVISGGLLFGL